MDTETARLDDIRREFRRAKRLADGAIAQIDDDTFFAPLGESANSIAIIVKHVSGNMRSRWTDFLTTDGEKPDRHRDTEFVIDHTDTREALTARWESAWATLFDAIEPVSPDDLERTVTIRREPLSVWQAILRQLTHYSYHVGQIVTLARLGAGDAWESLSVPRGKSQAFNENPKPYISDT